MSPSPFSHLLTRSFGILLALLLLLVGIAIFNFRALSDASNLNTHTYKVINGTLQLEQTLLAIDSGARGFIVAGEKGALRSYRTQLRVYNRRFDAVHTLVQDAPPQIARLNELDASKRRWVSELLEKLMAERQTLADPSQRLALAARSTLPRRAAIAQLQSVLEQVIAYEERLLSERTREQQRLKAWTQSTLLGGGAFSILLTGFLVLFASKGARQLGQSNALLIEAKIKAEESNERLLQINAQLESEVAARRASDEKLRRSVLELRRSNAELEQFAYVASHDLQEPLRAVAGCVQVLQRRYEGRLDARADAFIQHAVDGAQRMQTLINDLLTYSRLGSKTRPFEAVEGAAIAEAALQSVSVGASESGAQITVDALPILMCDRGQIEQVLQNLLSNALKFRSVAPPRIHIGYTTQLENEVPFHVLWVEDDGIGIEPQYFERIFAMFQRLHTRSAYPGTGIGLAICKKIIERHGGKIWVESWPIDDKSGAGAGAKHGSKFTFSLPFEPENPQPSPEAELGASGAKTALSAAALAP